MRVLILPMILLASCSPGGPQAENSLTVPKVTQPPEFRLLVPQAAWEPIFFEAINKRAAIANLPTLRAEPLPKDDLEVRVWIGFGLTPLTGFDLKRSAGQWSGTYLAAISPRLPSDRYQRVLSPKSGWESLWRRLTAAGILSLPDAEMINCSGAALDGVCYVVETKLENTYRTYLYDNPQYARCSEAKKIIEIGNILYDEFAVRDR